MWLLLVVAAVAAENRCYLRTSSCDVSSVSRDQNHTLVAVVAAAVDEKPN